MNLIFTHKDLLCALIINLGCVHGSLGQYPFEEIGLNSAIQGYSQYYGIAVSDFDNDYYEDLIVTFTDKPPRLFRNNKGNSYTDVTEASGFNFEGQSRMCVWIDINNDRWMDIFVAGKNSPDQLFINKGDNTFINASEQYGVNKVTNTFSLNISEINDDPYLDLYLSNFLQQNTLYLNEGVDVLKDRVNYYQLWDSGKSMASIFFDYDNDGDDDLYLVHDGNQPNTMYQNIGDGYYKDVSQPSHSDIAANGMGVDIADINLDGCMDMNVTNLYENKLLLNNCDGTFNDISQSAGVDDYGMGWGTTFVDYNNDGYLDILVCNDSYFSDYPNVLFRNNGDLTFTRIDFHNGKQKTGSYGCVCTDLDLDGKMDLAIANQNPRDEFQLLKNIDNNTNNWVGFYMEGKECNIQGIGTRIKVSDSEGLIHVDQLTGGNGYASQGSPLIHFGLSVNDIEEVEVLWTDGTTQTFTDVELNHYYHIIQGDEPQLINVNTGTGPPQNLFKYVDIYPNPATDYLNIKLNNVENSLLSASISDISGRMIDYHPAMAITDESEYRWRLSEEIKSGVYFICITFENSIYTQPIFIQR